MGNDLTPGPERPHLSDAARQAARGRVDLGVATAWNNKGIPLDLAKLSPCLLPLTERAGYQEHFRALCSFLGQRTPTEADSPTVKAIADAARRLVGLRGNWLNPPDLPGDELKKRTLTNLYNARPASPQAAQRWPFRPHPPTAVFG